jgi:hypothetical protein
METPQLHKFGRMPVVIEAIVDRIAKRRLPRSDLPETDVPPKEKRTFWRTVLQRRA